MIFSVTQICALLLAVGTIIIIYLERKFPYRRGIPFFRDGFWTDVIGYTIIQSFLLKIIIFDYIILPIQGRIHWEGLPNISAWPLWIQELVYGCCPFMDLD